jgi:hypothetical protein
MAPYGSLLSAKYSRAFSSGSFVDRKEIKAIDLSLAILVELVPPEVLTIITIDDAIRYRKESESARDAFLECLLAIRAKVNRIPAEDDYAATINKIITAEVRPAAREFCNKLDTIYDRFLGNIKRAAVVALGSPGIIQIFGDITLQQLLLYGVIPAAAYVVQEGIGALVETKAASRDCALSYLLDLETKC